jgi:hypothetical protein
MSSNQIAVGSIQHYVPGSTWFDLSKYQSLGTQERVSVNLAKSNLWLIDSSKLLLASDYAPRIAFINEGAGYRSPVRISGQGATYGEATVFSDLSGSNSILPSANGPLKLGDWVQVSKFKAGTQVNLSVIPNGVFNPKATPLSTDSSTNPVSPFNPNSPVFWTAYADPKATAPIFLLGYEDIAGKGSDNDFNDGILALDLGAQNFQAILNSANLGQNANVNLKTAKPIPVPFETHTSVGLFLVVGLFGKKLWSHWLSSKRSVQL